MSNNHSSSLLKARSSRSFERLLFGSETSNGGGSDQRSIAFLFCQLIVLVLRAITPFSYIYLLAISFFKVQPEHLGGKVIYTILTMYMLTEALFFPYYLYLYSKMNKKKHDMNHLAVNKKARMRLVKNCINALRMSAGPHHQSPEEYIRRVSSLFSLCHFIVLHNNL